VPTAHATLLRLPLDARYKCLHSHRFLPAGVTSSGYKAGAGLDYQFAMLRHDRPRHAAGIPFRLRSPADDFQHVVPQEGECTCHGWKARTCRSISTAVVTSRSALRLHDRWPALPLLPLSRGDASPAR